MSGSSADLPGGLYPLVVPREAVVAGIVSHAAVDVDDRAASGLLYLAAPFALRLDEAGAVVELDGPGGGAPLRAEGAWARAVPEVMTAARRRVRDALPERYVRWLAARAAMPREAAVHEAPDVTTTDEVLALLRERFGDVMSPPELARGSVGEELVRTRLYDTFDVATGLEQPRGSFGWSLRLSAAFGLGALPGEPLYRGSTPESVRRAFRLLDEYCRARLDLPPRADDEETP